MIRKQYSTPYLFYVLLIELFEENRKKFHFHQPRLVLALLLPKDMAKKFPALSAFVLLVDQIVFFQLFYRSIGPLYHWDGRFAFS